MASDSTSIDDLPGGNNVEQQNRVVLEKTEIQNGNSNQQPPIFGPRRNAILRQLQLWNSGNLKAALAYLVELDLNLRSVASNYPASAMTERLLIRVAMLAKR